MDRHGGGQRKIPPRPRRRYPSRGEIAPSRHQQHRRRLYANQSPYHPNAFKSLLEAFDPELNVAYAASFLKELHMQKRSWQRAVRFYHSSDPKRQQRYGTKVYKARVAIRAREVKQRRLARLTAAQTRRDQAASQRATTAADDTSATVFTIYRPRNCREQRRLENRARNWAFSIKRR